MKGAAVEVVGLEAKVAAAFGAYFDICVERGLLLGELEQAVSARRISAPDSDGTDAFLEWLAELIDAELGVGTKRAWAYAAVVASNANVHAGIWRYTGFSRRHMESTAVAFAVGGLLAAVAHDDAQLRR